MSCWAELPLGERADLLEFALEQAHRELRNSGGDGDERLIEHALLALEFDPARAAAGARLVRAARRKVGPVQGAHAVLDEVLLRL